MRTQFGCALPNDPDGNTRKDDLLTQLAQIFLKYSKLQKKFLFL